MPRLMAAIYDRALRGSEDAGLREWRQQLLSGLGGDVLEIGPGTGLNLPHYPETVRRLVLSEPDRHMRRKLAGKLERPGDIPAHVRERAELVDAPAETLPFPDRSFDAVVVTLVLCSVRDLPRTLAEIRRVLRPGGRFVFVEHVASDDPKVVRWQKRLEPFWIHLAGNCHLARRSGDAIAASGLEIESLESVSIPKTIAIGRPGIRGVARKPVTAGA
ncbi:MAG TPA: class I SAM-dependent methyltransferase [Gemmatimonadota bacterium]|jgi:ubiquinone/menaquinone biosynthesis C-methylase UbiE